MSSYRFDVGQEYAILICFVALSVVLAILWFVPGRRRGKEKGRSERLSLRVMTVSKKKGLYSSQVLSRFTVYSDGLVWCFFTLNEFKFKYIKVFPYQIGSPILRLSIHGIAVEVWGIPESLRKLSTLLEAGIQGAAKNGR